MTPSKSTTNLWSVVIIATIVLVSATLLKLSLKDDSIKIAPTRASAAVAGANQSVVNPSSQMAEDFKEERANLTDTFQALPESGSESIANTLEPFWTISRTLDDTAVTDVPFEVETTSSTFNSGTSGVSGTIDNGGSRITGAASSSGGTGGGTSGGTGTGTDSSVNNGATDTTPTDTGLQPAGPAAPEAPPSPDDQNKAARFDRLTTAFDQYYQDNFDSPRNLADGSKVYYLRQELQALIDMWRATDNPAYLEQAKKLVFKAIADAKSNRHQLFWHNQLRGNWPCFFSKGQEDTGGHNQLNDFQGSAGFMMVAAALNQAKKPDWKDIADFVEDNIIEKWLYYNPNHTFEKLTGPQSNIYMLNALNTSRDKREHFASICLDLSELGYQKYPYRSWSQLLFDIYLTEKTSLNEPYTDALYRSKVPTDWGLYHQGDGTLIWSWGMSDLVNYGTLDTSHANRTIWAACQAFEKRMLPENTTLNNLIVSFKKNIWAAQKGPFYFNNFIDGNDGVRSGLDPGKGGNVWFGWHRLAAYDESLKELFISLGDDLANGGPNVIGQNKGKEAHLCLVAWAARLISSQGKPEVFP